MVVVGLQALAVLLHNTRKAQVRQAGEVGEAGEANMRIVFSLGMFWAILPILVILAGGAAPALQ